MINPNCGSFDIKQKYYPKPDKGRQIYACVGIFRFNPYPANVENMVSS
jgi:hypothetical protein